MKIGIELKKAMLDNCINATQLAEQSGVSYQKLLRILKDEPSAKLVDLVLVAAALNLNLTFTSKGL